MTLTIVETRTVVVGQPVVDYFTTRESAQVFIDNLAKSRTPDPATPDDIDAAFEWPFAVVPSEAP